ncbi:protease inhibitor I42 family protein [Plesiomonas shigelloides]|uniref:protease inhibitor I42 family protein n=1 Tax=Plesiomonas shigelloides TaxID=703 RepID=UPI002FCB527B
MQHLIELPANPTTGYTWLLRELPDEVALLNMNYQPSTDCKLGMTGSDGKTILQLLEIEKGHGDLVLQYARPFEKLSQQTHSIKISVTE